MHFLVTFLQDEPVDLWEDGRRGDLKDYEVHADDDKGMACDLLVHSLTKSFRPGTACFDFAENARHTVYISTASA